MGVRALLGFGCAVSAQALRQRLATEMTRGCVQLLYSISFVLQKHIWKENILDFIGDAAVGCWSTTVGAVVVRDSAGSMGFAAPTCISPRAGSAVVDMTETRARVSACGVSLSVCRRGLLCEREVVSGP